MATSVLQLLHDSEINCGIKCCWDSCWTAWIGDDMNGVKSENTALLSYSECETWLAEEAINLFPGSDFATA